MSLSLIYFVTALTASAFAPKAKKVLFFGKNLNFYEAFETGILETNIDSKVDFTNDFTKENVNSFLIKEDYDYVIAHEILPDVIGVLVECMHEYGTNNFISLSSDNLFDFGVNSVEGLCDHFNITYCDLKYNVLTKSEPSEKVGVYYEKTLDFVLSSISEHDLVDFCNECVIDGKNPYLNERIFVKEAKEGEFDAEIAENNDIVSKYAEWFGVFPKTQKWKNVRFTIYSMIAGYLLAEGIDNIFHPDLTDFWA